MTTAYDPSTTATFLRTVDLAAIGLGFLVAGDPAPSCYQPHEPVADDDPALPPMQYDAVVAEQGWDPLAEAEERAVDRTMAVAGWGTDAQWWDESAGMCGGCALFTCHEGRCVDDEHGECRLCPERAA